jgi:tyrosine aminotransferase
MKDSSFRTSVLDQTTTKDESTTEVYSPTSVAQDSPHHLEPIVLNPSKWICPASQKSMRTINPIRAIVDPIAKNILSGSQRGDGKDHISLAVS